MKLKEIVFASAFFLLLTLIFFYKIFLGYLPLPTDIIVGGYYPWVSENAQKGINIPVKNPILTDAVSIFYPLKSFFADTIKKGELPLWNPYMFAGYPLLTNPTLGLFFPTILFYLFLSSPVAWTLQTMSQPFFGSIFMFLFLRHLKLPIVSSTVGAISFGFGGFTLMWMQWNTQSLTAVFLPLLLFFEDKYLKTKDSRYGVALSVTVCLQIFAGYLPLLPMTYFVMGLWYVFFSPNKLADLRIGFYMILGMALSSVLLIPLYELISQSQRVVENLGETDPFVRLPHLIHVLAPDFFGNDATYNYWGDGDHHNATIYTGIAAFVFALAAFSRRHQKVVRFMMILIFATLVLSFKNPLSIFIYNAGFWGGSSITMNRMFFIFNFAIATLAAFGISKIFFKYAMTILIALFSMALYMFINQSSFDHATVALRNLILPIILATLVLVSIVLQKLNKKLFNIAIVAIVIFDVFRFGWKFNTFATPEYLYPDTPESVFLQQSSDRFVAHKDVFPANMWVPFGISSLSGYDSIYPYRIAKYIAVLNSGDIHARAQTRWGIVSNLESPLLDIANVSYVMDLDKEKNVIVSKRNALPRAYLTNHVIKAHDEEALALLLNPDVSFMGAVSSSFEMRPKKGDILQSRAIYTPLTNTRVRVDVETNQDAFLVVSDTYYPGWKALLDGVETHIHRTNYNFRGVFVPEGKHTIEFVYSPRSLKYGAVISMLTAILLVLVYRTKQFNGSLREST